MANYDLSMKWAEYDAYISCQERMEWLERSYRKCEIRMYSPVLLDTNALKQQVQPSPS